MEKIKLEEYTEEQRLAEGEKQIGGIRILLSFFIAFLSLGYLAVLSSSFITMIDEDFISGLSLLIFGTMFYGVISLLYIFPLIGIKNRKAYTVPLVRTVLILFCFNLIGLIIVLAVLWQRMNNPFTKYYLNYFDGSYEIPQGKDNKELINNEVLKSNIYCYFCGVEIPKEAIYCKKCGKKQQ